MEFLPVPWLRHGSGTRPKDGGCIMQVIDWISTGGWTDTPACVHPTLVAWGIAANDGLPPEERQQLLTLVPRLMQTAYASEEASLAIDCVSFKWRSKRIAERERNREASKRMAVCDDYTQQDLGNYRVFWGITAGRQSLACLKEMLDVYDQYMGRNEVEAVDFTGVCAAMSRKTEKLVLS